MRLKLNSWRLFWVLALAASTATLLGLAHTDFHSGRGMLPIIHRSARCALPLFVLAFAASSLVILWPNAFTRWLLANRRYIGLSFAFAMALHLGFVAYAIGSFGNPLNVKATALDVMGLTFLLMMTLTSFRWGASHLSRANWRRLHKAGVYAIWFVATNIYVHVVFGGGAELITCAYLVALFAAWMLRVTAWTRQRLSRRRRPPAFSSVHV